MMGAGKTTIGKAISKQLSIQFIDIDKVIENKLGLTIQEIFEKKGEAFFRKFEEKITLQEVKKKNRIIEKNKFLFKFNNFISDIFFNFLLWSWKIKFTKYK